MVRNVGAIGNVGRRGRRLCLGGRAGLVILGDAEGSFIPLCDISTSAGGVVGSSLGDRRSIRTRSAWLSPSILMITLVGSG